MKFGGWRSKEMHLSPFLQILEDRVALFVIVLVCSSVWDEFKKSSRVDSDNGNHPFNPLFSLSSHFFPLIFSGKPRKISVQSLFEPSKYQTTRCHIAENSILRSHRRENHGFRFSSFHPSRPLRWDSLYRTSLGILFPLPPWSSSHSSPCRFPV
jgi:hypothetical protein